MNALREIKKVKNGKVEIDVPKNLDGKDVEVIVLMGTDASVKKANHTKKKKNVRSLAGILHKYANPALILKEKEAWPNAVKDKHGLH